MTSSFSLQLPPQIIFGPGKIAELEKHILRFGFRPLLVLGSRSFSETDQYHLLQNIFSKLGVSVKTVHIGSEPSPEVIDSIVADPSSSDIDLVIAIGGGATLDGGKAISAMLTEGGKIARFLEGVGTETPSGRKLPFIAVPTTSGTGSEATSNAVISSVGRQGFKSSLRHDHFIPNLALVDPGLTLSCPQKLTVACGMDCFTQLVEGYLSTNSSSLPDALSLDGIRAVQRSLRPVCADGNNLSARTDLSYAALLSGIVLANSGLGTVHGFASVIGGYFAIPHGVVCGTLMAPTNTITLKNLRTHAGNHPALAKYTELGRIFSDQTNKTDGWYQDCFIEALERLAAELNIPKLSEYGMTSDDIKTIVEKTGNKYNPAQLSEEELTNILYSRVS
ncbi:MAG: iron-containing alcohol dehydrogenase [Desulforhopalus sp.]